MNPLAEDYPNYATALAVLALRKAGRADRIGPLVRYLRQQQLTEENGWRRDHAAYGAWGMGGDRRTPPDPGHVDLSMTRYVLQALAGATSQDPAFERAQVFLDRCRNPDGGFCFSTVELGANKAGQQEGRYRGYGTATADGLLSLLAAGARDDDERVVAARRWLVAHHEPGKASGFVDPKTRLWAVGLRFYYAAACAEAVPGLVKPEELVCDQRPDGSWCNVEPLVKENDPLIATALAVWALGGLTPFSSG
jgi:hypothetical protein